MYLLNKNCRLCRIFSSNGLCRADRQQCDHISRIAGLVGLMVGMKRVFFRTGVNLRRYSVQGNDRMRVNISRWTRLAALGVVVISFATTGCSSGWKMPSMKMPWSKKPSESALAGSGPSSLTYPESPATKQHPTAIASAAAGKAPMSSTATPPASGAMAQFNGAKTMPAAYGAPSATGAPVAGYKPPATGTAAAANGYATGPYNTSGQAGAAGSLATAGAPARANTAPASPANQFTPGVPGPAAGYAASNPYAPPPGVNTGLPSNQAYGGGLAASSYGGRPAVAPAVSGVPPQQNPASMGQFASAGQPNVPSFNPTATPVGFAASTPPASQNPNPMTTPMPGGMYSPVGTAGAPNGYAQSAPSNPAMGGGFSMPNAQPNYGATGGGMGQVPAQMATYSNASPSNLSTASYRPGSTSRTTGYNFASQGTPQVAGAPASNGPAYTAGGNSNPGYSLPPSSTLNR